MSYIDLLNSFFEYLQADNLSPNAQLLYYTLLQINNKCCWKKWFFRTNSSLSNLTGLKETALTNARAKLVCAGLIEYVPSKKRGTCTRYHIVTLQGRDMKSTKKGQSSLIDRLRDRKRKIDEDEDVVHSFINIYKQEVNEPEDIKDLDNEVLVCDAVSLACERFGELDELEKESVRYMVRAYGEQEVIDALDLAFDRRRYVDRPLLYVRSVLAAKKREELGISKDDIPFGNS